MTELERRLRAAMAAADEPPPAGLLDGIRRRHRRHVRRAGAAWVGAVAAVAIAVPLVTQGIRTGPAGRGPGGSFPAASSEVPLPPMSPILPPRMVFRDCASSNNGTLGRNWKAHSVHAGPVWFIYARSNGSRSSHPGLIVGKPTGSAMVIAIRNGSTAMVADAPAARERFRFLDHFHGNGKRYTLAEGAPSLTMSGCPASPVGTGIPERYAPGLTMFWLGYVTDLRGCVPLKVTDPIAVRPITITVPAGRAACDS
jgi:hypothetical protein